MTTPRRAAAPKGDLSTFAERPFSHEGTTHRVFHKGTGPAVIVITEMPGISPQVLGFADRVVALGCSVALPDLFGQAGRDPLIEGKLSRTLYGIRSISGACVSREFTVLALGKSSPIVTWLRALAKELHEQAGGPGVGVVGMCFTGGFALAMAVDPRIVAPVMSQPSLPFRVGASRRANIDVSPEDLETVAGRCQAEGLRVIGLRFKGDPFVPEERFPFLSEKLGDGFVAIELEQSDGHPEGPLPRHHSVLTADLIDEPGEPTRVALDRVLDLFRNKLLTS